MTSSRRSTLDLSNLSLEHQVALLPLEEQEQVLATLELDELQYDWGWFGRPSQMLPIHGGDAQWNLAVALAGRGFG
jgi:hypothetical protein